MAKKKHNEYIPHPLWIALLLIAILSFFLFAKIAYYAKPIPPTVMLTQPLQFDFGNKHYMVNNEEFAFGNNIYKSTDKRHSALITNRSTNPDNSRAAAILINSPEGSGTFYYVVGAMMKDGKEVYSAPVLLGDRIKVISVKVDNPQAEDNGVITVKYLKRPTDAPESAEASVEGEQKYAFEDNGNLIEILN